MGDAQPVVAQTKWQKFVAFWAKIWGTKLGKLAIVIVYSVVIVFLAGLIGSWVGCNKGINKSEGKIEALEAQLKIEKKASADLGKCTENLEKIKAEYDKALTKIDKCKK